jgi:CRP-like cAMP-binding protein
MRKVLYILGELEDTDLQWLIDAGDTHQAVSGTDIIREGGSQDRLFILLDGELSVQKAGCELARLGAGEIVGDMSLLDSRPPNATVTTVGECRIFAIPHAALRSKLTLDAEFGSRFYRALCVFLANRLSRADSMIGAADRVAPEQNTPHEDEISPEALDTLTLAGARFDWFLQRVGAKG